MASASTPSEPTIKPAIPFFEFIALMAAVNCLIALSVDSMLPALSEIGRDLRAAHVNDTQMIVTFVFLGVALGQFIYGAFSDAMGRKPTLMLGLILFFIGSVVSAFAPNMEVMLFGRFLQGFGAAGPRIASMALVRDQYVGAQMARVMSLTLTVFIMVPIIAPMLGQLVLYVAPWRAIFALLGFMAIATALWFGLRQPETLPKNKRTPFNLTALWASQKIVLKHRGAMAFVVAQGLIFGSHIGFLGTSQQLLQVQYGLGDWFTPTFASLAFGFGVAAFINSKIVVRLGINAVVSFAILVVIGVSAVCLVISTFYQGLPPLWVTLALLSIFMTSLGLLMGNLQALSMEPFGHVAGAASGVIGGLSTCFAVTCGFLIGEAYDQNLYSLVGGIFIFSILAKLFISYGQRWRPVTTGSPDKNAN